jgi:prolyl 4-hydroxylase
LRLYRYGSGERHGAHWDTVVELSNGVQSLVTLVFYLNDGFEGGETDFPELGRRISPKKGSALLFQHRVLHEAMIRGTSGHVGGLAKMGEKA